MAFSFRQSKRPYEGNPLEPNGRGKWQKTGPSFALQSQPKGTGGAVTFRLLFPSSKFGNIIGKGGGIVAKIRQETGAKVKIEESVPGCEERVVVITGSDREPEVSNEQNKEDDVDTDAADGGEDAKTDEDSNEEKEKERHSVSDGSKTKAISSAQKALLLIFERIIEGESDNDDEDDESRKSSVSVRLLVLSSQVGCLLGKGGSVIKQMSADSGAQIRILPRDKLPLCASSLDEIVQISGGIDSARKALQAVSQQLMENPPRDSFNAGNPSGPSSHSFGSIPRPEVPRADVLPPPDYPFPMQRPPFSNRPFETADYHQSIGPPIPKFHEGVGPGRLPLAPELLTFRLLCSNDKVGSIIGKGGSIIRTLQHETGCDIKVLETSPESDDRIIVISGPSLPDDRISPAQDAVLRVQHRIAMALPDNKESAVLSRLLVSSNQTGCLLGKGGAIIAEMRKFSGAHIRILGKDQVPKSVSENDEVVQVTGELGAVQEALLQITTNLRHHLFRDKLLSVNHMGRTARTDQLPPFGPYMGRESSPPRMLPLASSFPGYDPVGHPLDGFAHRISGHRNMDRIPPAPWGPQGMREGSGSLPIPDYGGGPQRRMGGFPGGSQSAIITNTTVDVVVPRAIVPSIYGEDGGCLKKIREISEAKITITEPRPEATETVVIISGTPEQTHAAQSLLQAFVMCESGSP